MSGKEHKGAALTAADARVASAGADPFSWRSCKVDGCSHLPYRYGHCRGHYFAILKAKKKAAESPSSTARSDV